MFRFNVNWYQTLVVISHFFYNTSTLDHAAGTNTEMTPLVMSNDKPLPSPAVQLHLMVTHIWWLDMNFASEEGGRGCKGVGQGWRGWTGVWGGLRTWLSKIANLTMQKCACSDITRQQWGSTGLPAYCQLLQLFLVCHFICCHQLSPYLVCRHPISYLLNC